jgi:hypothetical protein
MKKIVFFMLLIILAAWQVLAPLQVAAQQNLMYQSCEAGITFLNQNKYMDEKLPGTVIVLSGYSHQLEIRTVLPSNMENSEQGNFNQQEASVPFDLKMTVSPYKMQRTLTSEKVFTTTGILLLNNISRSVVIEYTALPEDTDNDGQMRLSVIATFNLSDFFPNEYPNESVAFVINNGFVNRQ